MCPWAEKFCRPGNPNTYLFVQAWSPYLPSSEAEQ